MSDQLKKHAVQRAVKEFFGEERWHQANYHAMGDEQIKRVREKNNRERPSFYGATIHELLNTVALERSRSRSFAEAMHHAFRMMQAAYAAGNRDGAEVCMKWLGNALSGPGLLPYDGADPDWYASDGWSRSPYPEPPWANKTGADGRYPGDTEEGFNARKGGEGEG